MSDHNEDAYISPECFRAYVSAEIKVPNTLVAVGPYVGRAVLASLQTGDALDAAVKRFGETFAFSGSQMKSVIKTVVLIHRRFGIPVLPEGADLKGKVGIRIFEQPRFEVVYMEGVMNILESILRLHGMQGTIGTPRHAQVADLLADPAKLVTTATAFAAAEKAINSPESTEMSEAFKDHFNFVKSGETPRAMAPAEKDAIQAEVTPFIVDAVGQELAEDSEVSASRLEDFVHVLTSPELHEEAA